MLVAVASTACLNAQDFKWAKHLDGAIGSGGKAIAADNSGNVYSTGYSSGTTYFDFPSGSPTLPPNGAQYGYIAKNDSSGNYLWIKQFGGGSEFIPLAIALDNSGNIYTSGVFSDSVDFDPGPGVFKLGTPSSLYNDSYISKLDASGNFVWAKKLDGAGNQTYSIAVDNAGSVFLTGMFTSTMDADPGPGVVNLTAQGVYDIFISKLNSSGDFVWAHRFGAQDYDIGYTIKADNAGSIYCSGYFRDTVDFDPGPSNATLISGGGDDVFITKFDTSGNFIWARQISGAGDEDGNAMVMDASGNCYVTGLYTGTANFDPGVTDFSMTSNGAEDIYIAKFDSSGGFAWAKSMGGFYSDVPYAITKCGNDLYLTGTYSDKVDFDPGPSVFYLNSIWGSIDGFIARFNTSGNLAWAAELTGPGDTYCAAVAADTLLNVYVTGYLSSGATDFDPSPLPGDTLYISGGSDGFLMRLGQTLCSSMTVVLDSLHQVTCNSAGSAFVHMRGGLEPYSYSWNTVPVSLDSSATFSDGGIYQLTVSDSNSCVKTLSLLINAPDSVPGFDLGADLISDDFRPGYESYVWVNAFNKGCAPASGTLTVVLDTSKVTFNYSDPSPDYYTADTLVWMFNNLTYDSPHLLPMIDLQTDTAVVIGDSVCFKVIVSPVSGDLDSANNSKDYCFGVVNGFDPNDKTVYPVGSCSDGRINNDQLLTYTIRFQNTGNSNAINIHVIDSLDAGVDLNSVKILSASHSWITEVLPGNVLKFRFDSIMLPPQMWDDLFSHGYVIYEVKPLQGLPDGTVIKNHAGIYFDFNPPVITDTTLNTVFAIIPNCSVVTAVGSALENPALRFYPNPARDFLAVENIPPGSTIKLYDFCGRLVLVQPSGSSTSVINTGVLQSGIFLVEVSTEAGLRSFHRLIINHE